MRQTILMILFILLILAAGVIWFRFARSPAVEPAATPPLDVEGRLAEYRQLQTLRPDLSVFADPLFRSLRQAASPIGSSSLPDGAKPSAGRPNPFSRPF